jgi:hypothetical protein
MYQKQKPLFNEAIVLNIRRMLENANMTGSPLYFEFKVDGMLLIPMTNQFIAFDTFREFIHSEAQTIEFTIYSADPTNKVGRAYPFLLYEPEPKAESPLQGMGTHALIEHRMERFQLDAKIQALEKEIGDHKTTIVEQDEWIEILTAQVENLKAKPNHLGEFNLVNFAAHTINAVATINPKLLKAPTINGIIKSLSPQSTPALGSPDKNVSVEITPQHSPNSDMGNEANQHEVIRYYVNLGKELEEHLGQEELDLFFRIAGALCQSPNKVKTVAELLDLTD